MDKPVPAHDEQRAVAFRRQLRQARQYPRDQLATHHGGGDHGLFTGLAAIAESHFRLEERALGAALDAGLPDTGWSAVVFRPAGP